MTQDKISVFLGAIRARSEAEIQKLTEGEDARRAALEKDARDQAEAAAETWLNAETARIEAEEGVRVLARRADDRRGLLEYRQRCSEEAFGLVRARIAAFTASPDYAGQLAVLLTKALDGLGRDGEVTVLLRREDMMLSDSLRRAEKNASLRFEEESFTLGGLQVLAPGVGKRADLSFDSALQDLNGRFAEFSGLEIE